MSTKDCNLNYLRELTNSLNGRDEDLKKHTELVQLVFDNCPAGLVIWAVDKNLIFTLSEGRGLKNLGIKEGQSIGKSLYEYFDTVDDSFEPIQYHIQALNGTPVKYDFTHLGRVWHTHCTPVLNKINEVVGVAGCAFDITEYVEQQQKIEELEKIIKDAETCSQDKMELIRKLV
tara:strand:+ start:3370 stop:3891 length:522 start_codon:yes stop_codon:yes gene_type:complete